MLYSDATARTSVAEMLLFEKVIREKLTLPGQFAHYVPLVAIAYNARPDNDGTLKSSLDALKQHVEKLFKRIQSKVSVIFQPNGGVNGDYKDAADMSKQVKDTGVLYIDSSHNNSPIFTPKQNLMFRAVHDYVSHIGGNHAFDARGEIAAYNRHAKLAPPTARPALFTEIVGQASYYLTFGEFGEQKAVTLYGFDYDALGKVDPQEYTKNFDGGQVPKEAAEHLEQLSGRGARS